MCYTDRWSVQKPRYPEHTSGGFRTKSLIAFCIGIAWAMYWQCVGDVGTKRMRVFLPRTRGGSGSPQGARRVDGAEPKKRTLSTYPCRTSLQPFERNRLINCARFTP